MGAAEGGTRRLRGRAWAMRQQERADDQRRDATYRDGGVPTASIGLAPVSWPGARLDQRHRTGGLACLVGVYRPQQRVDLGQTAVGIELPAAVGDAVDTPAGAFQNRLARDAVE